MKLATTEAVALEKSSMIDTMERARLRTYLSDLWENGQLMTVHRKSNQPITACLYMPVNVTAALLKSDTHKLSGPS